LFLSSETEKKDEKPRKKLRKTLYCAVQRDFMADEGVLLCFIVLVFVACEEPWMRDYANNSVVTAHFSRVEGAATAGCLFCG
jgi:hypothetical protein